MSFGNVDWMIHMTFIHTISEVRPLWLHALRPRLRKDFDDSYRDAALPDRVEGKDANKLLQTYAHLKVTEIGAAGLLHDGGRDASKRCFLAAAAKSDKIAVVDSRTDKLSSMSARIRITVRTFWLSFSGASS